MRISILSGNTYVYQETISKVDTGEKASTVKSADKKTEKTDDSYEEKFDKILKEIQQKLNTQANNSLNSIGTSNSASSVYGSNSNYPGKDVSITDVNYQSIAPDSLKSIFAEASKTYGIDQKLLELIGYHESRFQEDATSKKGAMGIMQLMPSTAESLGVTDAYDPQQNIMGAAKLLKQLYNEFNGNLDYMLSGYSAGSGAVKKYGGIPPYEETTNYIEWIHERYP